MKLSQRGHLIMTPYLVQFLNTQNPKYALGSICYSDATRFWFKGIIIFYFLFFFIIRPPSRLLPVLGPLEGVHDSYTWRSPAYLALGRVLIWVRRRIVDPSLDLMNSGHFRHIVRLLQLLYIFTSQLSVRYCKLLHPAPCYLNSDKVCLLLSDQYRSPERDSNPPY